MHKQIQTHIKEINVNECTYHDVTINSTLINLFYGRNGSGKSTLTRVIKERKGISWQNAAEDTEIAVFDEDYIERTIKNYSDYEDVKGVFVLPDNAQDSAELDQNIKERDDLIKASEALEEQKKDLETKDLSEKSRQDIWDNTKIIRNDLFPKLPKRQTKTLFQELMQHRNQQKRSLDELQSDYKILYDDNDANNNSDALCELYSNIEHVRFPTAQIIYKPLISRSNTEFAKFIKAVGNLEWVRLGHDEYLHKSGQKCPFCQREGMDISIFTKNLESCYDEQYRTDIEELKKFVEQYKNACKMINFTIQKNAKLKKHPAVALSLMVEYQHEYIVFKDIAETNTTLLDKKLRQPSLEGLNGFEDIVPCVNRLSEIIQEINKKITAHNNMVKDIKNRRLEFQKSVYVYMATMCEDSLKEYDEKLLKKQADLKVIEKKIDENKRALESIERKIAALSKSSINTITVMNQINETLRIIGFKGFYLRQKSGKPHTYEWVRSDGTSINANLSEGERNFIAFLYFYHKVLSRDEDYAYHNKIVVIDDPVSSLDHQSLFYVSALIRDIIEACYKNYVLSEKIVGSHIKQIFCLTHSPLLFREISSDILQQTECVSIFEIKKDEDNNTFVEKKYEEKEGQVYNYSPIQTQYEALWYDIQTTKDRKQFISAAYQILHFHFIRMCGYNSNDFKDAISKICKDQQDDSVKHRYHIAYSMVRLIEIGITHLTDDLLYDLLLNDIRQMREAFSIIFNVMHQEQHYDMMMMQSIKKIE